MSGHVSCKASAEIIKSGEETELIISFPSDWIDYVFKRICLINSASLTVAKKTDSSFSVYLIPETLSATNLSEVKSGKMLNIEVDQATYAAVKAAESS